MAGVTITPMSERDEKRGGSDGLIGLALVFLFVPVLYVLAIGPAAWFDSQLPTGSPFLRTIYTPLDFVAENCAPIGKAIHWYVSFWK
jgi:hypothetical protein